MVKIYLEHTIAVTMDNQYTYIDNSRVIIKPRKKLYIKIPAKTDSICYRCLSYAGYEGYLSVVTEIVVNKIMEEIMLPKEIWGEILKYLAEPVRYKIFDIPPDNGIEIDPWTLINFLLRRNELPVYKTCGSMPLVPIGMGYQMCISHKPQLKNSMALGFKLPEGAILETIHFKCATINGSIDKLFNADIVSLATKDVIGDDQIFTETFYTVYDIFPYPFTDNYNNTFRYIDITYNLNGNLICNKNITIISLLYDNSIETLLKYTTITTPFIYYTYPHGYDMQLNHNPDSNSVYNLLNVWDQN